MLLNLTGSKCKCFFKTFGGTSLSWGKNSVTKSTSWTRTSSHLNQERIFLMGVKGWVFILIFVPFYYLSYSVYTYTWISAPLDACAIYFLKHFKIIQWCLVDGEIFFLVKVMGSIFVSSNISFSKVMEGNLVIFSVYRNITVRSYSGLGMVIL